MMNANGCDELFHILSNKHRRRILIELHEAPPNAVIDAVDAASSSPLGHSGKVGLRHSHLPKLQSAGLVESSEMFKVKRGENWDAVEPTLSLLLEHESRLPSEFR